MHPSSHSPPPGGVARQLRAVSRAIERDERLDAPAEGIQQRIADLFAHRGESGRRLRDTLHGVWLGHPLHPILVAIPIGAWTAAGLFDLWDALGGWPRLSRGATAAVAVGLVGSAGSAATGLTDWQHLDSGGRRVGLVHGLLNAAAAVLYTGSLLCRLVGRRGTGRLLGWTGLGLVTASGYLGGELSYSQGVGVDHAKIEWPPADFVRVLPDADLKENEPRRVEAEGVDVLLVRQGGRICALHNLCAHLGGPLHEGKVEGGAIVCPWHASRFDLATGDVIEGPSVYPQPRFDVRVRDGQIEVRGTKFA